ncbi:hypothetical protein [Clostridium porci]|uniref:Uncharacterized protein n=1 Tax=Clostridium porci TaxID=2605778 RepID=A0A7X2NPB9_9CLOT|nr:hypothetical protein [Clostridium porci]MSS38581.1 hypothetical protein [Clostridium porci]
MQHDMNQIRSLQKRVEQEGARKQSYDKILNDWMGDNGILIQDPDTIDYYLTLIPIMERRLEANEV